MRPRSKEAKRATVERTVANLHRCNRGLPWRLLPRRRAHPTRGRPQRGPASGGVARTCKRAETLDSPRRCKRGASFLPASCGAGSAWPSPGVPQRKRCRRGWRRNCPKTTWSTWYHRRPGMTWLSSGEAWSRNNEAERKQGFGLVSVAASS